MRPRTVSLLQYRMRDHKCQEREREGSCAVVIRVIATTTIGDENAINEQQFATSVSDATLCPGDIKKST